MKNIFLLLLFAEVCVQSMSAQTINRLRITDNPQVSEDCKIPMMLVDWFGLPQGNSFVDNGVYSGDSLISETSTYTDSLGYTHMKYNQYFNGVLVEGTTIKVHLKDGHIVYANGEYYRCQNIVTKPSVGVDVAVASARNYIAAMWNGSLADSAIVVKGVPEAVICHSKQDATDTTLLLCYRMHVMPMNGLVYINAYNGTPEGYVSATNFTSSIGSAYTRYNGIQPITTFDAHGFLGIGHKYYLYDEDRRIHTKNLRNTYYYSSSSHGVEFIDDNDNVWTTMEHQSDKDDGALDAHWGLEQTYDYFLYNHGWRSLDNHGCDINAFVHAQILEGFDASQHCVFNTNNSIYDAYDDHLEFGDGSSERDILTSLDIVAHEFAHGIFHHKVNSYDIDMAETNETNAINEGLSDIWGACVENWATTGKQTWLIGEDTYHGSGYMRNMANPKAKNHPDTYKGQYWDNPQPERHQNAGVLNYWFYLLANGGAGTNDFGYHYNVNGIGIQDAAKIVFRAETTYMDSQTDYRDACEYTIRSARELYHDSPEVLSTIIEAWRAVGLLSDYYTRDNIFDDGTEPNMAIFDGINNSPDIWVRRNNDGGTTHQTAMHNSTNYVYITIHAKEGSISTEDAVIKLYRKRGTTASPNIWDASWSEVGEAAIPPISDGDSATVCIPVFFPSITGISWLNNYDRDYALLTRIVSDDDEMSYTEGLNTALNVIYNNNISCKNIVVSNTIWIDGMITDVAISTIDNSTGDQFYTTLKCSSPQNEVGSPLYDEAEIRLIFDTMLIRLWMQNKGTLTDLKKINDSTFLVIGSNAQIHNFVIPANYEGNMIMQVNFLTQEYSEKDQYEYIIDEYDPITGDLQGSLTVMVDKPKRSYLFDAESGNDMFVMRNTDITMSADNIGENAIYNWYNASDSLIGSGENLSVTASSSTKYKLEVIATSDGYKDYDSIYVTTTLGMITNLSPNPANSQVVVSYDLSPNITSAVIVIANAAGQVFYAAALDVDQTSHTINLQSIPTGQYTIRVDSQGSSLDVKTLIVR